MRNTFCLVHYDTHDNDEMAPSYCERQLLMKDLAVMDLLKPKVMCVIRY